MDSDPNGLEPKEISIRFNKFGFNRLKEEKKQSELAKFFTQFKNPLVYLLIFAAIITYFLKHNIDTVIILIIVLLNAIIGYVQEKKAEESLEALKKLVSLKTRVIRGGERMEIPAEELVPGDIVMIDEGTKIPADIRLLESDNLRVDESILTGESVTVHKKTGLLKNDALIADQTNMLFAGTVADTGHGLGVVVEIGENTELAKIAHEVTELKEQPTPIQQKLAKFSKKLLIAIIWICTAIFIVGLIRGFDTISMFLTAVAAAVSVIPEGLPAVITITLAVGVSRMAKQNAIVRKMSAVETLGQITTIASDKTGTLTYNQMTLEKIIFPDKIFEITGEGYTPKGDFKINGKKINPEKHRDLEMNLLISMLCNNANLIEDEKENAWKILGDPTEGALLVAADKAGIHEDSTFKKFPRLDEIPFESKKQYMATLHQIKGQNKNLIAVKGTVEKILHFSKFIDNNGKIEKLSEKIKEEILSKTDHEARQAYRIIASAYRYEKKDREKITDENLNNLVFAGFSALMDPPREEVKSAIAKCRDAGIRVVMITGDFPGTAIAIGHDLGIKSENNSVLSGDEIQLLSPAELKDVVKDTAIFARITPELKLKIVEALQKNGQIVAVTGDGVNDAPILKLADVGISMGRGGTDVAREASDMILVDNNFNTIANAIEEGRTIFQNIRRSIFFLLSTNAGEALILFVSLLLGLPLPLSPVQILWINLITDGTSGFSLAMEPKHSEILKLKPRSAKEGVLDNTSFWRIFIVAIVMTIGTLFLYQAEIKSGASIQHARTVAFVTMALFQIFNILNSRSLKLSIFELKPFSNLYIVVSFILMTALTFFTSEASFFQKIFNTESLSLNEWARIALIAFSIIVIVELEKMIRRLISKKS